MKMVDNSLVLAAFGIFFSFEDGASISLIFINCLGEIEPQIACSIKVGSIYVVFLTFN
jgi:hypothetical protein